MKEIKKTELSKFDIILSLMYVFITILAITARVSNENETESIIVMFWPQILVITLLAITNYFYTKKELYGALLELTVGSVMVLYVIVHIVVYNIDITYGILNFVFPILFVLHSIYILNKVKIECKEKKVLKV